MLFNSTEFFIFFIIVFLVYTRLKHKPQNILLLVASYIFYAAWDWRFISLILLLTCINFGCGLGIGYTHNKKLFLISGVASSIIILAFFKYFGFFIDSLTTLAGMAGLELYRPALHVILPLGISFYTFQAISYIIDIYRNETLPTKDFIDFSLYIAFFPQLVAGPIEKSKRLLPQIQNVRHITWSNIGQGTYLIIWGLFMKVVVADNLAKIVEPVYSGPPYYGPEVIIATIAFAVQIYCDFAGYTNIARGVAKFFGFDLILNFNLPYFAINPREFWQRWHISLSTWLRDYLYIPLGGNRKGNKRTYLNLFITMLLGGLWHGAAWTFVIWGAYHGCILMIYRLIGNRIDNITKAIKSQWIKRPWHILQIIVMFGLICTGWMIFRSQSILQVGAMCKSILVRPEFTADSLIALRGLITYAFVVLVVQVYQYYKNDLMAIPHSNVLLKSVFYIICIYSIIFFGADAGNEFIYFQF